MLINQQQRDELELALSCTDHEYRLPVKHKHLKTDYTTSGFSREEVDLPLYFQTSVIT